VSADLRLGRDQRGTRGDRPPMRRGRLRDEIDARTFTDRGRTRGHRRPRGHRRRDARSLARETARAALANCERPLTRGGATRTRDARARLARSPRAAIVPRVSLSRGRRRCGHRRVFGSSAVRARTDARGTRSASARRSWNALRCANLQLGRYDARYRCAERIGGGGLAFRDLYVVRVRELALLARICGARSHGVVRRRRLRLSRRPLHVLFELRGTTLARGATRLSSSTSRHSTRSTTRTDTRLATPFSSTLQRRSPCGLGRATSSPASAPTSSRYSSPAPRARSRASGSPTSQAPSRNRLLRAISRQTPK
jgi:hypothetical protein